MATYSAEELNFKIPPSFTQVPPELMDQICTAIRQKKWNEAQKVLSKTKKYSLADELVYSGTINPAFALTQKLLQKGMWEGVGEILQHDLPDAHIHTFAVLQAAMHADCHSFRAFILPYCSDDELCIAISWLSVRVADSDLSAVIMSAFTLDHLPRLLKHSVSRGYWNAVGTLLDRGVDQTLKTWAVKEARRKASERDFILHVSYHCSDDQLDTTLTQLVTLQYWKEVGKILLRPVSDCKRRWAVEIASLECSEDVLVSGILPHACDDQLTAVLRHLVLRNQWKAVGYVLQRGVPESSRAWAVAEANSHADAASFVEHILPHCRDLQVHLEDVLFELVSGRKWRAVGKVLQWGVNRVQLVWVAEQVHLELHKNLTSSSFESKHESVTDELPSYGQDFAILLLAEIFKSSEWFPEEWKAVSQMLHLDVNNSIRRLVLEEACRQASSQRYNQDEQANTEVTKLFMDNIMPHYHGHQAESLLIHVVKNQLYEPAKVIIAHGVNDACKENAVSEAVKQLRRHIIKENPHKRQYEYCLNFVASFCSEEQAENILMLAVYHRQWSAAGKMLARGLSDESRNCAAGEAWQLATCKELATHFLPYMNAEQRETILTPLVAACEWSLVGNVLERGVSNAKHKFAVVRACTQADQSTFFSCIWPHCNLAKMETYLPHFLKAGEWYLVGEVLKHNIHSDLRHQASLEAIQRADQTQVLNYIWPHCDARHMQDCLPHLVRKGLWLCVEQVLRHTDDPALYRWAVDEACKHANFSGYLRCVRVHFSDHDLSSVLTVLLEKHDWPQDLKKWEEVGKILDLGVSDPVRVAAVNQAVEMTDDDTFAKYFVPHHQTNDDNHNTLLYTLCHLQKRDSVFRVLQQGISGVCTEAHYYALAECSTHVRPDYFIQHVLQHCSNETLGHMLERMCSKLFYVVCYAWELIAYILQRGVDSKLRSMALEKASTYERHDIQISTSIVPLCSEEELESLLPKTGEHRMWNSFTSILDRGVTDSTLRNTVDHTFTQIEEDGNFDDRLLLFVLPYCSGDLLESILEKSLSTHRWAVVGKILQIGVDESLHRRCVERACATAGDQFILQHILPYCRDDQLNQFIGIFIDRVSSFAVSGTGDVMHSADCHFVVLKIIQRGCLTEDNQQRAVESLCGILKSYHMSTRAGHCHIDSDKMLNSIKMTVTQHEYEKEHRERESSEECILLSVLQHCPENQVSDLLDGFIARKQWKQMCLVLRRGVDEELRRSAVTQAVQKLSNTLVVKEDRRLFLTQVVPHCAPGELHSDDIFVRLVQHDYDYDYIQLQHEFRHIGQLIRHGVSERKLLWAAKEALEGRTGNEVLLFCSESQICSVISELVKSAKSSNTIVKIFKYIVIVSDATCAEFTQMAVSNARNTCMPDYRSSQSESGLKKQMELFLGECPDDTKEAILDVFLEHKQWKYVDIALNRHVSEHTSKRVIEAAVELASPEDLLKYLHVHLSEEQVEAVAKTLMRASSTDWELVSEVFDTLTLTETTKKCVIEKARQQLASGSFRQNTENNELMRLFSEHALDSEVENVLMNWSEYFDFHLVACNEWVCKHGPVNAENVHKIDDHTLAVRVIQHVRRSQIDAGMLGALVASNQWETVMEILCNRGLDDADTRCVVEEASKKADRDKLFGSPWKGVLSFCDDEALESALAILFKRKMLNVVAITQVVERCKTCVQSFPILADFVDKLDNETFKQHILGNPADVLEPGTLVKKIVARGLWNFLKSDMLERVSDEVRQWVVDTACKQSEESAILSLVWCIQSENLLAQLFRHSVSHGLLTCVCNMLCTKRFSVIHEKCEEAIKEVCKQATDEHIAYFFEKKNILFADLHQLDLRRHFLHAILDKVVTRGLWQVVGTILDRDIEDSVLEQTLEAASKQASDTQFSEHILQHYSSKYLECVLPNLLTRGCTVSASEIVKQGISDQQKLSVIDKVDWRHVWISPTELMKMFDDDQSFVAIMAGLYKSNNVVHTLSIVSYVLHKHLIYWAKEDAYCDGKLMLLIKSCHVSLEWKKNTLLWPFISSYSDALSAETGWSLQLSDLLSSTLFQCVFSLMQENSEVSTSSGDLVSRNSPALYREIFSDICRSIEEICLKQDGRGSGVFRSMKNCSDVVMAKLKAVDTDPLFVLEFLKSGIGVYQKRRKGKQYDNMFILFMAAYPVVPQLNDRAVRQLLRKELDQSASVQEHDEAKWNAISQASRSNEVWEHTRRLMFQAAVKHKQWFVVERWPSHMLYNDQRWWALEEAYKHKQWKVMLALSNMGLTTAEQMLVHNRLVKFADWETAKKIFTRGADVTEMRDMLQIALKERREIGRIHKCSQYGFEIPEQRLSQLIHLEQECMEAHKKFGCKVLGHSKWIYRLFHLFRCSRERCVEHCFNAAVTNKTWRVVMHLAKTRLHCNQMCSLFPRMVEARQWAVCRVLLEQVASDVLCEQVSPPLLEQVASDVLCEALPKVASLCEQALLKLCSTLLESRQWVLVAMLVDGNITDHRRREILQCALKNREGSVVWQCVRALETPLSVQEREQLFDVALHHDVWQAVKPLVEVTDSTGIHHRDTAFLEAIWQNLWDVVDYCQLHHADINAKDENGETPLHRAARGTRYTAVEEIVSRGGDPNQQDTDGISALNHVLGSSSTVKVLVEYLADIHRRTPNREDASTPLEKLITAHRGEDVAHTLIWCPGQKDAVSSVGETALHAACRSMTVCVDSFYYLVARGVDPFALTKNGHSALVYSLTNEDHPQVVLAKCIELGFSTHQPALSANWEAQHMKARQHHLLCTEIEKVLRSKKEEYTTEKEHENRQMRYGRVDSNPRSDVLTKIDQVLEQDISLVNSELQRPTKSPEQLRSYFERQMRGEYSDLVSQLHGGRYIGPPNEWVSLAKALKKAFRFVKKHAILDMLMKEDHAGIFEEPAMEQRVIALHNILQFTCRSKFILTCMLYESGALTNGDLWILMDRLLAVIDFVEGDSLIHNDFPDASFPDKPPFKEQMRMFRLCTERVQEMASTPRTLMSACRLKFVNCQMSACRLKFLRCLNVLGRRSHDFREEIPSEKKYLGNVRGRRAEDVVTLPLSLSEKKYVMFSDLTNPDYGREWQGHLCVQVPRCLTPWIRPEKNE